MTNAIPKRPLPAAIGLSLLLCTPLALAETAQSAPSRWLMCSGAPLFDWLEPLPASLPAREQAEIEIDAEQVDVSGKDVYRLDGDVRLQRADQHLRADRIDYTHSTSAFAATGDVRYQDRDIALGAVQASGVLREDRSALDDVRYQLIGLRGRGEASRVQMQGPLTDLSQVGYTTCDPGNADWWLSADRIELDHDEGVGRAHDATVRLGRVPILWLPYATFPIDDRRRSGFLYPVIGTDNDGGIDLRVPYYLNLAPNYDATIEGRLIGNRGLMLGGEFRWLGRQQEGIVEGTWLPDDDETGDDRGLFSLRHDARLGTQWSAHTRLNHVSDDRYFEDFGDSLSSTSISLLESSTGLFGRGHWWNASIAAQAWDVTDPNVPDSAEPFRRLPKAVFDWRRPQQDWLELGFYGEAVAFDHSDRPGGQRYDLRPSLALPVERAWGFLRPQVAYRHTSYRLDSGHLAQGLTERNPSRGLPIYSFDAGLYFERPTRLFGSQMLQTLEPRLYYLRVPYEDQSDLPIFDTHELSFSFDQLFRSNRFGGADRQMDANQATLALTSRWFESDSGRERLSASVGQIRYFDPQRVQLPGRPATDLDGSAYVGELDLTIDEHWRVGVVQHWDPELDRTTLSGLRGQWHSASGALANLAYRYRRDVLEQVDGSFVYPVAAEWRLVGRWNYSLRDDSTLEAFGGVEWESCCVAVRVLVRHYLRNREGDKNNALYVELELKGLASLGRRSGDLLERAILGYSRTP